ncbi:MAG TPA: hypothetical protein VLK22_04060, partial [Candidatus Udaeobacter sp.]|nr:hypothetical protein [Candidatus Udaeobacter sp.]
SVPAGISCGSACSASFNSGTSVTLTATAVTGNTFAGWTGACSGTGTCTVSMTAAKSVGANFTANTPNPVNGVCGSANGGTFTSAPTTNLCSVGAASSVNGSGPWTWTCAGTNGGTTASCGAQVQTGTTTPGSSLNPTTPNNLYAAGILPNAIYLKWSQSDSPKIPGQSGATIASYRISRDGSQIASVNARTLQFQDTGVAPNTTHSYSVVAVDSGNKVSAAATASASTIPAMPVGSASTHPVLFPAGYIAHLALGGSDWAAMKQSCDSGLNSLVQNSYAGWEWRDAAVLYSTCYTVAKQQGDTTNATKYAKKDLALAKVLAHDSNLGTADPAYQPIGLGNNSQTVFTLPFTPMFPTQVRVSLVTTHEKPVTRTSGHDALGIYAPIMKVSNTSGGANDYASTAYTLDFRDKNGLDADHNGEMDTFNIRWLGATKPNSGATYFVTVADGAVTNLSTGSFSVNGTTLTLNSAPGSSQAVFVSYIGSQYEQTGNGLGGLNSIEPDGPGYQMRTFNPGLATAYDALHDSGLLTPAMMTEFYTILNDQVDWCTDFCFENDGSNGETGNYFVRGLTESTFMTAYATDVENPRATEMKTRANLFVSQIYKGVAKDISDGEWLEGQYANGMINDILQLMSLYNDITHLDLLSSLEWTNNIVPAIIHGTKPGFRSFYDSGDWSPAPATPIDTGLKALRQYLPNNPTAPFAGKLLQELGENPMGSVTDYRNSYPLSFLGKVQSPIFSRSDWSTNAVWMSLASNDVVAAHQHMDAGHIEINRAGKDLLRDAGAYGDSDTLPWHNTIGIDDRGFGNHSVYPPGQAGWWDQNSQITKRMENGLFTYGKADIAPAYTNNDGVSNSVTQGLRSVVFLRPDKIVVFDQIQTANAGVKKIFNLNFGGPLNNQGGIWSTTVGTSTLFMQPLLAPSAAPVTSQLNGQDGIVSTNYQETTSGNTKDVFLHVFQASASSVGSMTTAKLIKSVDRNVQGTEVSANGTLWATLFAAFDRTFGGNVQYALPSAGTHKHLVNDLVPSAAYVVSVTNAQGAVSRTMNVNTDSNGSLTFDSADGETYFYVSVGSTAPTTVPPVNGDPNA